MVLKLLFFQIITKNRLAAGGFAPMTPMASGGYRLRPWTPVCDTFQLLYTSLLTNVFQFTHFRILTRLVVALSMNEFLVTCQHQATTSDLPFCDISAPPKNSSFEVSDDVVACDLWFAPPTPKSKILVTPMA